MAEAQLARVMTSQGRAFEFWMEVGGHIPELGEVIENMDTGFRYRVVQRRTSVQEDRRPILVLHCTALGPQKAKKKPQAKAKKKAKK